MRWWHASRGGQDLGGGPTAQHVCRAHVRLDTHANTHTHAHVRIHTHVAIPCVLVVPGAACRPCHRHSSWSPPVVHVTACGPCHCHSSILRCTHCRVQCCHAAMLALRGRMLDRRSCACTPHLAVCMELHLYSTHDRRVETAWLRPQVSHQAPRPHLRPCAALRSHLLPPPGQSAGGKKKVNVYKGSFFYLLLRHWLATHQTQCHPGRTWTLYCGTVLVLRHWHARNLSS